MPFWTWMLLLVGAAVNHALSTDGGYLETSSETPGHTDKPHSTLHHTDGSDGQHSFDVGHKNVSEDGHHDHNISHHDEHHGEHVGVHVVSWNYNYVAVPLVLSLFLLAVGIVKLLYHYAECLATVVPESCLLIIFGIGVGAIFQFGLPRNVGSSGISADDFKLEPRLFMLFLLPPIVLDSAYSLNDRVFADNLGTILLYAVVGTVLNCFIIGPILYGFCISGVLGPITISFVQCLLFASFIVAVDPVAVLAIFQEVGVNNVLYFLVFGESLLNDAVTVVLYNMMKAFNEMDTVPVDQVALGVVSFFTVSLGGLLIGAIFGISTAFLTRATSIVRIVEPLVIVVMAYLAFVCAELVHWSGIISMITCGILQAEYAFHNVSDKSLTTVSYFIKMISSVNDAVIFLFLGLEVMRTGHQWHTGFVLCSLFLCLIIRLFSVYSLTFLANHIGRTKEISLEEQFIMWYGGLRGAVCFALCATLSDSFQLKNLFLTTTLVIVFFTVFVQGITIKPLVSLLKITRKDDETHTSIATEFQTNVNAHIVAGVECVIGNLGGSSILTWVNKMNDAYFRRWFQTNPKTKEQQFLEAYQKIAIKDHVNHIYEATSKVVAVGVDSDEDDVELPMLKEDDSPAIRKRHKQDPKGKGSMGVSDLASILGKSYVDNFSKGFSTDLGRGNIMQKLKEKHARIKENKRLRTPTTSRRGSISRTSVMSDLTSLGRTPVTERRNTTSHEHVPDGSQHVDSGRRFTLPLKAVPENVFGYATPPVQREDDVDSQHSSNDNSFISSSWNEPMLSSHSLAAPSRQVAAKKLTGSGSSTRKGHAMSLHSVQHVTGLQPTHSHLPRSDIDSVLVSSTQAQVSPSQSPYTSSVHSNGSPTLLTLSQSAAPLLQNDGSSSPQTSSSIVSSTGSQDSVVNMPLSNVAARTLTSKSGASANPAFVSDAGAQHKTVIAIQGDIQDPICTVLQVSGDQTDISQTKC